MRSAWWKIIAAILVIYTVMAGFMMPVPRLPILHESIRNLYFHVPMWFGMIILFVIALVYSVRYLISGNEKDDLYAVEYVNTGVVFGILGLVTGMVWAKYTWGQAWSSDPKQNGAAALMLIYFAYFILRSSISDEQQRAKVSAVYNIFAAFSIFPLIFFLPRMTDSLHPGNGGNPGFNKYDLDNNMRMVFYPAVIGWSLLGVWIATLRIRFKLLQYNEND
jgi:heme exporter protein C